VPNLSPREVMRGRPPGTIQVVRTDSSCVELRSAIVVGDSLVGLASGLEASTSASPHVAIPLSQVSRVAIRQPDRFRTLVLIAAVLLGIVALLFALAFGQGLSMWYDELAETED
jgi:hypothetical protein